MPEPITISQPPGFYPGQVTATRGVMALFPEGVGLGPFIARHLACDWGDLGDDDKARNDEALEDGSRLLSAYETERGRIWILTEAKDDDGVRLRTTVLLPEEY